MRVTKVSLLRSHALLTLLLSALIAGCASFGPPSPSEEEKEEAYREQLSEHIIVGVRDAIREEILPELNLLSQVSPKVREAQNKAQQKSSKKIVVGRIEWVGFNNPSYEVQARVDTGAQTCSLHAENIEEKVIEGETYVQFETLDQEGEKHVMLRKVVATRKVRSTSGNQEKRYVIRERITFGGKTHEININLNNRSKLRYRFLVGRNLLMGQYVVDVSQSRLLGR